MISYTKVWQIDTNNAHWPSLSEAEHKIQLSNLVLLCEFGSSQKYSSTTETKQIYLQKYDFHTQRGKHPQHPIIELFILTDVSVGLQCISQIGNRNSVKTQFIADLDCSAW